MKMSVNDAAEHFGVSKEAIHNRIRRGSLEVIIEDGVKFVIIDTKTTPPSPKKTIRRASPAKVAGGDDRYYKFLEEQNAKLQSRVEVLEGETRTLRDQKELMLIEERKKIEAIYKEKDEQLKNILSSISSQFMLTSPEAGVLVETVDVEVQEHVIEDVVEEDIPQEVQMPKEPLKPSEANILSLKKYINTLGLSPKKAQKVKQRFEKRAKRDRRIITLGEKIYLDTLRYDYSDLLKK